MHRMCRVLASQMHFLLLACPPVLGVPCVLNTLHVFVVLSFFLTTLDHYYVIGQ